MTEQRRVEAEVNGRQSVGQVDTSAMLAEHLRDNLGLTGTKVSCEIQVCGACTVLVDGNPVSSCTYFAVDIDGRTVDTVEGLARGGRVNDLQQAFLDRGAFQCGFCTPGFLMMATALLAEDPRPSEEKILEYLDGNICRCTGYQPIVEAILAASGQEVPGDA